MKNLIALALAVTTLLAVACTKKAGSGRMRSFETLSVSLMNRISSSDFNWNTRLCAIRCRNFLMSSFRK